MGSQKCELCTECDTSKMVGGSVKYSVQCLTYPPIENSVQLNDRLYNCTICTICTTVQLYNCTTVQLYNLYNCTTVQLYCTTVPTVQLNDRKQWLFHHLGSTVFCNK